MKIPLHVTDGGRAAAGYTKGKYGDCVVRAIAIASEIPYQEVLDNLTELSEEYMYGSRSQVARILHAKKAKGKFSPQHGAFREVYHSYLLSIGMVWVPTMLIGSGCQVHLRPDELPAGRLVLRLSRHLAAMIDGVLHDTHDCSREGTRCVYGFYHLS